MREHIVLPVFLGLLAACANGKTLPGPDLLGPFPNPSGLSLDNPFFKSLGSNGRGCATCHQASDGWTVTPGHLQERFEQTQGTDPGRALVTGKWADISKFKGPILHALATRAPYVHNGATATLENVVNFHNPRFSIGLSPQEIADLVAFLKTL